MIKPRRLRRGDKVAIVSLSRGMIGEEKFIHKYELAKKRLEEYGLEVVAVPNALKGIDYLYRHPEARAQDLMDAFRDSEIKAVFNAIGGDDTIRLLPYIDFDVLRNNPKIFTGFSDSTTNHFMMYKAGLVSYYGLSVMNNIAEYVAINEYTKQAMEKTLFTPQDTLPIPCSDFCSYEKDKVWWNEENINQATPRYPNTGYEVIQGSGKVTGELLGGCIDVFAELLGREVGYFCSDEEFVSRVAVERNSRYTFALAVAIYGGSVKVVYSMGDGVVYKLVYALLVDDACLFVAQREPAQTAVAKQRHFVAGGGCRAVGHSSAFLLFCCCGGCSCACVAASYQ